LKTRKAERRFHARLPFFTHPQLIHREDFRNFVAMHLLQYIHWDREPSIFGFFSWYGLLFASSFAVGYWLMVKFLRKEGLPEDWIESLTLYMGISTVVGARLGHCLFYDPEYYLSHPLQILKVWEGGLASHGAAIGIITGLVIWSMRVSRRSVLWILDRIVILVALSGLFIRTGNLMNSEILGETTNAPYGVVFPRADQSDDFRAKWDGDDVDLSYAPRGMAQEYFSLYRLKPDSSLSEVRGFTKTEIVDGRKVFKVRDVNAGHVGPITYFSSGRMQPVERALPLRDSLDPVSVKIVHEVPIPGLVADGKWEGEKIRLRISASQVSAAQTHPILLMGGSESSPLRLLARGTLGGDLARQQIDTLVTPPPGNKIEFKIIEKEAEILLTARHAGMMYEALAYTLIFAFLLWLYYRKDAKIERGLFFGLFLVMVFGVRIVIEAIKENQEAFDLGIPLNMGQLLSIPFVLAGMVFIGLALRRGYVAEKPAPEVKPKS
jgi:prolipoprotein diacylglyceryltransferase